MLLLNPMLVADRTDQTFLGLAAFDIKFPEGLCVITPAQLVSLHGAEAILSNKRQGATWWVMHVAVGAVSRRDLWAGMKSLPLVKLPQGLRVQAGT